MLLLAASLEKLSFRQLMEVYREGNQENGAQLAPEETSERQLELAEQSFYGYLKHTFFPTPGAFYAVLEEKGSYVSALRMEPYRDGLLLEALETKPSERRRGYAGKLIRQLLPILKQQGVKRIYSHVHKKNTASLKTHAACGFRIVSDCAVYIDGSVNHRSYTLVCDIP